MENLSEARELIDAIDSKIINLYEKRMDIIKDVIQFKMENHIAVEDTGREASMLEKNISKIKNPDYRKYYQDVLLGFLFASKKMQSDVIKEKK